jgi:predicted tellurium resistance membrane protein TerC
MQKPLCPSFFVGWRDMADKPEKDLPKIPPFSIPFSIPDASDQHAEESTMQNAHVVQAPPPRNNRNLNSPTPGILSSAILLISVISLGIAMASGAWFAYSVLRPDAEAEVQTQIEPSEQPEQTEQPQEEVPADTTEGEENTAEETENKMLSTLSKIIVVGLAYAVGWIFSVIGVRAMGNLILPYAIRFYTWCVLGGIIVLQVLIMSRLYRQEYQFVNYIRYLSLFGAGLIALVGLHIILEKHSLRPFGFVILLASLGHLYTIVYHYVFATEVAYEKIWGDIIFFFVTTSVSVLMIAHFGFLNGARRFIARMFSPQDNQFGP